MRDPISIIISNVFRPIRYALGMYVVYMTGRIYSIPRMAGAEDRVVEKGDGVVVIERTWGPRDVFYFVLEYYFRPTFWMIPGVVYCGNRYGDGVFPRPSLRRPWFFREDRCTIPSAGIVEDGQYVVALFVDPARSEDELSSVSVQLGRIVIRIPWFEGPLRYTRKGGFSGPAWGSMGVRAYKRRFFIIYANYRELGYDRGYYFVLERAWRVLGGKKPEIRGDEVSRYVRLKAQFAVNVHYFRLGHISSFLEFCVPNTPIAGGSISAGFTGKSLEAALSLYRIYLLNNDERLRDIAFSVADFHCRGLRDGLFYTDFHIARQRWYGYIPMYTRMMNTRLVGEALFSLLRLYILARGRGEGNRLWLDVARRVANIVIEMRNSNGDFGRWIDPKKKRARYEGTNGAYIVWFLSLLHDITGDRKYLDVCEKAMDYYIREFVEKDIYWGDTLDADCIDKEGAHGIMRACLLLYERTGKRKYLDAAIRAAYYLTSWMFMWDIPFGKDVPIKKYGLNTRGWTIVSVENQHIDPYGMIIAPDMVKLYKYSNMEFWLEIGLTMAKASMGVISDRPGRLGVSRIFVGFQPEQIYHTEWIYSPWLRIIAGILHGAKCRSYKGTYINNIFWVVSACLGGILDLAEELGIELDRVEIEYYNDLSSKIFRFLRSIIAILNLAV